MKRVIASTLLYLLAGLLLAGCKTMHNDRDIKPVSSAIQMPAVERGAV